MGGERINCGAETDGKKGSLCKLQSNFNRSDKMLPRSVWFCLDSAAANTFICNWQGDLEACIRLYFLSGELVVTKFPRAQGWTAQGTAVGWFWVESFLPLCAPFQSLGAAASPLSVTHGGPDFKKRGKKNPPKSKTIPCLNHLTDQLLAWHLILQWPWDAAPLGTQTPAHPAAQTLLNLPTENRTAEPPTFLHTRSPSWWELSAGSSPLKTDLHAKPRGKTFTGAAIWHQEPNLHYPSAATPVPDDAQALDLHFAPF